MSGRTLGVMTSQSAGETVQIPYIATTVTQTVYIASIPVFLTSLVYRIRVASTSGTATFYKTTSGTAAASGTAVTGAVDLGATPAVDTTLTVTLLQNAGLTLNPGDGIAMVIGGTMTNGVGMLQLFFEPQS